MSDFVQISRDPFARQDIVRRLIAGNHCKWCGGFRYKDGKRLEKLYQYGTQSDSGSLHWHTGVFCCKSCHNNYHH